jgi:hypothetical protein
MRSPYAFCFVFVGAAFAAEPPTLSDNVRKAVANKQLSNSDNLQKRTTYHDLAGEGGVLVGFEVGLSKWFDKDIPYALRPIYRDGTREWDGEPSGSLQANAVRRTVRTIARPGYAVGGLWVRQGAGLDRICLRFFKVRDGRLDPADNYSSPWIGNSDGGSESYFDGGGLPVVGTIGDARTGQLRSLGLVYARVPKNAFVAEEEPAAKKAETEGKTKLEQEAPVPVEDGDSTLFAIVAAVISGAALLIVVLSLVAMSRKPPAPEAEEPTAQVAPAQLPRKQREPPPLPRKGAAIADRETLADRPAHPARPEPYLPATSQKAAVGSEPPPYFLVRSTDRARFERMTRIYVLPEELLVVDVGSGSDHNLVAGVVAAKLSGGGMIGALVGGAVSTMVADDRKSRGEAIQQQLDRLDLAALLEVAASKGNFRAPLRDVLRIEIDPPEPASMWRPKSRAVGTFRFRDIKRGEFHFEFLCAVELRGAIEVLRRNDGSSLRVGTGWDSATARYIESL